MLRCVILQNVQFVFSFCHSQRHVVPVKNRSFWFSPRGPIIPLHAPYPSVNSLAPERCASNFTSVFSKLVLRTDILSTSNEIEICYRRVPENHIYDKSTLVQTTVWCHKATSHELKQAFKRLKSCNIRLWATLIISKKNDKTFWIIFSRGWWNKIKTCKLRGIRECLTFVL